METRNVLLDTNFLLIPGQFKVDIFEEIRKALSFKVVFYVLDQSLAELDSITSEMIKKRKEKDKIAALIGKQLVQKKKVTILKTSTGKVDDLLVKYGKEGFVIATQDRILLKRLKKAQVTTLILRQKKYVVLG